MTPAWPAADELLGELLDQPTKLKRKSGKPKKAQLAAEAEQPRVRLRMPPPTPVHLALAARDLQREEHTGAEQHLAGLVHNAAVAVPAAVPAAASGPAAGVAVAAGSPAGAARPAPAGWVAWQPPDPAAEPGAAQPAGAHPCPPLAPQQHSLLRSAARFLPLTACQPGRALLPQTLQALLGRRATLELPAVLGPPPRASPKAPEVRLQPTAEELAAQRQLVLQHPELLLLLEHPVLQRCGACAPCRNWRKPRQERSQGGSSQCRVLMACGQQWKAQCAREVAAQQEGQPPRADAQYGSTKVPLAGRGVPEADALRAVAAYKLMHPLWRPALLTPTRLAAVAAALPAAAAALAGSGGSEGEGAQQGQRWSSLHYARQQQVKLGRLLHLLRDPTAELEPEPEPDGHAEGPEQPEQPEQQPEPDLEQPQLGASGASAFSCLPRPGGDPHTAAHQAPPVEQRALEALAQPLRQLPTDVQAVFRASLSAGLALPAVEAALRRYLLISGASSPTPTARPNRRSRRKASQRERSSSSEEEESEEELSR